ncbi:MAG: rhomboid family intramembrane serine protease [Deltaproteobacteria bacterium]|nr:rhomboid family intramembrane serine protease [Deltaproteobacteria bacterium]
MIDPSQPRGRSMFGGMLTPMVKALIISIVGVYALELIAINWLEDPRWIGALWLLPADVVGRGWAWQILSYMWLHDPSSPLHIVFNLFMLYMFGGFLERRWGSWAFLRFFLITGAVAGLTVAAVGWFYYPFQPTIGCSGAVLAVATAFGIVYADAPVFLFGLLPMRARTMLLLVLAFVLLDWVMRKPGISVAAHLGGMAAGFVLVKGWWRPSRWRRRPPPDDPRVVRFERKGGGDGGGGRWVN